MSNLNNTFLEVFGKVPDRAFFSPGRVNLIGEHTDYNGGNVFPCAITFGTYGLVRKREDKLVRVYSMNFKEKGVIEFSIDNLEYDKEHNWANFVKGMFKFVGNEVEQEFKGMDLLVHGTIPNGSGLSSSASLEMLIGVILDEMYELTLDRIDVVKIGKKVENEYIGVNSGIMDQFAIGMGKENHAILLDCQTLVYEYAPIKLADYDLVIMNTKKRRELVDSKYNERRAECEKALALLQSVTKIESLGQLTCEEFEEHKYVINDETLEKRAKHAVYENQRTIQAVKDLKAGNVVSFGELMNQSHVSLREDYDVTGIELDCLVETAWEQEGVLGARMTGAGFGGCAIAIVEKEKTDNFIKVVGKKYADKIGYEAEIYLAGIGGGTCEISLEGIQ